jgi:tetratricopeptide (TPR) repeat protein
MERREAGMRRIVLMLVVTALAVSIAPSNAVSQTTIFRYPRVHGPTGSLYGPTQAHYQYRRQYGRAWHGQGGLSIAIPNRSQVAAAYRGHAYRGHAYGRHHHHHSHFGHGYSPAYFYRRAAYGVTGYVGFGAYSGLAFGNGYTSGYANYGPVYNYTPIAPVVRQAHPLWIGPNPFNNSVIQGALKENQERWNEPVKLPAKTITPKVVIIPSTPEAKLKSMRHQAHGDDWFRQHKYTHAWSSYKQSIAAAGDQAAPRFRLAFTYTALGRFKSAVHELKQGLEIDPVWPLTTNTLGVLYDEDNLVAKNRVLLKVADWVRGDIRDPDRLFLMGVLLHCDGRHDKANPFFDTAYRLKGSGDHLVAFLKPQPAEPKAKAIPQPPQPGVQNFPPLKNPANNPSGGAPPKADPQPPLPKLLPLPAP